MPLALQLFVDDSEHSFDEAHSFLAARCDLTDEKLEQMLSPKLRATWSARVKNTWNGLERFGLTLPVEKNVAKITEFGIIVAEEMPAKITRGYLQKFPDFFNSTPAAAIVSRQSDAESVRRDVTSLSKVGTASSDLLRDPRNVSVWFGTNRKPSDPDNPEKGFSTRRDTVAHFGKIIVNIPEGHKVGGDKRSIIRKWFKGTPGLVLKTIQSLPEIEFWETLGTALLPRLEDNSLLLFLHGYRQTFEEAAIRTAQLKYDLKIPHAAFFSWPSKAILAGYLADGTSVEAAAPHIARFLTRLGALTATRKVKLHIVAHSMGNRGLLLALERMLIELKGSRAGFTIDDIVFAAADVDREKFIDSVSLTYAFAKRRTLYASREDRALQASARGNAMIRAGSLPPVTIQSNTDTIDVPNFDFDMLGHGYYASARPVLQDMFVLMHYGTPAARRQGMEAQSATEGTYWRLT